MAGRKRGIATQTARTFELLRILLKADAPMVSNRLGSLLGVTGRQVRRDLDVLVEVGIDIYSSADGYSVEAAQVKRVLLGE